MNIWQALRSARTNARDLETVLDHISGRGRVHFREGFRPPIPINTIDQCDEAEQIVRKALSVINHRRRWLHMLDQRSECPSSEDVDEQRAKTVARYAEFRKMRDQRECEG